MPAATWRFTTSSVASAIICAAAFASAIVLCSRPNNTSVTACERGRLPTWVVRIRSVLVRIGRPASTIRVVRSVVAAQPALELRMRLAERIAVDVHRVRMVQRELDDHAVGIGDIYRAAIAVLEHEELRLLVAGVLETLLDARLRFLVHVERDVMEGREWHLRAELLLVTRIRELEEGQGAAVAESEETMRVGAFSAEQQVFLAPGGEQRQADDLLVELPGRLEIARHVCRVV